MVRLGQSILNRVLNIQVGICPTSGCLTPDALLCLRKLPLGVVWKAGSIVLLWKLKSLSSLW